MNSKQEYSPASTPWAPRSTDYTDVNDCDNGAVIWSAAARCRFHLSRSDGSAFRRPPSSRRQVYQEVRSEAGEIRELLTTLFFCHGSHGKHGNVTATATTACLTTDSTDYTDVNDCDNEAVIWSAAAWCRFHLSRSDGSAFRRPPSSRRRVSQEVRAEPGEIRELLSVSCSTLYSLHFNFLAQRGTAPGDSGVLTLYGTKRTNHALFAEHVAGSETSVLTHGHGRDVREWRLKPLRPDNHWLDCLVGCAVAASIQGVALGGVHQPIEAPPQRKRVSLDEIQHRRRV